MTAGGELPYQIRIDNNANVATPPTTVTFSIPAAAEYLGVAGLENCAPNPPAGQPETVTCDVPKLDPSAFVQAQILLRPEVEGVINLTATIPEPGPTFTRSTTVKRGADLMVDLIPPALPVQAGSLARFSAAVTNNGPYGAEGAKLTLTLPPGLSPDATLPPACSIAGSIISCAVPNLGVDESYTFEFASQVITAEASVITLAATVSGGTPLDGVSQNNDDVADISVLPGTDVSLGKTRSPSGLIFTGDTVTFTLEPRVIGVPPAAATIVDELPANYELVSVEPGAGSGWTCDPVGLEVSCSYVEGAGTDFTAPIVVTAIAVTPTAANEGVTNRAYISSPTENEDAHGNNEGNDGAAFIADPVVDLVAQKSGPPRGLVTVGNQYSFRLRSYNEGNIGFSGPLTITDHLPAGLRLVDANVPAGWTCDLASLPLDGGPGVDFTCTTDIYTETSRLGPGQFTDTIELIAEVTANGSISNGMTVSFEDYLEADAEPGNNTVHTGVFGADRYEWADVSLTKTLVAPQGGSVVSGEQVTFEIEIANEGPEAAQNVVIDDRLQDIVAEEQGGEPDPGDVSISLDQAATDLATVCSIPVSSGYSRDLQCIIPSLPVCTPGVDCPRITVTMRAGSQGAKTNTAIAFSTVTPDPDETDNEDSAAYTVTPRTDVTIEKASPSALAGAVAGQEMVYVLTARVPRTGLSGASDVTVTDTLPEGLVFLGATPSTGSCSVMPVLESVTGSGNQTLTCNLGAIANGAQQTVSLRVVPTPALVDQVVLNTAVVSTSTPETDSGNNTAELPVSILDPELDLIVSKKDVVDPVEIGTDVEYRLTLSNSGPSDAFDVVLTDTLPAAGFINPRFTAPSGVNCGLVDVDPAVPGGSMSCSMARLEANSSVTVTLLMQAIERGRFTNQVAVESAETRAGHEAIADNNTAYEDTTVRERVDLSVTKVPGVSAVDLREEFSWTITTTNKAGPGFGLAEWVTLADTLPAGMELTRLPVSSVGSCDGVVGGREITCSFGDLAPGASAVVTLYTKITSMSAQAASNSATASTLSFEQNPADNTGTGSVTLVRGGTVSGTLYRDFNANDSRDSVDTGISGIVMTLTGTALHDGAPITMTVTTASDGTYAFTAVPPGTYSVAYGTISEAHLIDGKALPGTVTSPEASANGVNRIESIVVEQDSVESGHDFTRVPVARVGLSKVAGTPVQVGDGSFTVNYTLTVKNLSLEPLTDLAVRDVLDGASQHFGTYMATSPTPGHYTVTGVVGSNLGGGAVNTGFTGVGEQDLASGITLAPGATATITLRLHVSPAVPRVMPLEQLTNQAKVSGTGSYSGQTNVSDLSHNTSNPDPDGNGIANEPANNTPTTVTLSPTRSILLDKVATPERTSGIPAVGDRINYSFTVTNTGKTPLFNVTVADPMPGFVWSSTTTIAELAPGASDSISFAGYYILTQADIDNGRVANTATTTGQWGVQSGSPLNVTNTDSASVTALSHPELSLVKEVESIADIGNPRTEVGDEVRYRFTVTNTGNTTLRNVTITDALPGVAPDPAGAFAIGVLAPGETRTVYAGYAVKQADIDAGVVENSATATGTYGPGSGSPVTTPASTTSTDLYREPGLALDKTLVTTVPDVPLAGMPLTWEVTATNTGNVTLTNLVLTDPFPGATVTPASVASLAPGASRVFTVTAPLPQEDILDGLVENTATLSFDSPAGPEEPVDASSETPLPAPTPSIALAKNGDVAGLSTPPQAGDVITYTIVIRNTGNVALENLVLTDMLDGIALDTSSLDGVVLQPQNAAGTATGTEVTVIATYEITTDDIEAGMVENTAFVDGDSTHDGTTVSDKGGTTFGTDDPTITLLPRAPQIRLVKELSGSVPAAPQAGDQLTFRFTIENTGNVRLNNISLEDLDSGVVVSNPTNWSGPLAPGESNSTAFTGTYVLTQADIDNGLYQNEARVSGTGVGSDGEPALVQNDADAEVPLARNPGLSIEKSATPDLRSPPMAGDTIDYQLLVTNTGNVTLTDVEVIDPLFGSDPLEVIATLLPGEAVPVSRTYTVLQSDIEAGEVRNQASATYKAPASTDGEAVSNEVVVDLDRAPSIALVKSAEAALSDPAAVGETITYSFTVTNTGNLELRDVVISDPLAGLTPGSFDVGTLAPGASAGPFTAAYAITADDIRAGKVVNQATATGTHGVDGTVSDLSGATVADDEPTTVPVLPAEPALTIEKTASFDNGGGYAVPGDVITYTFLVTNTGNVELTGVEPRDFGITFSGVPATGSLSAISPAPATLGVGESITFTATYELTQDDLNNSSGLEDAVVNTADAVASYLSPIEDDPVVVFAEPDEAVLTLPPQEPVDIVLTKRALVASVRRGETAAFVIEVTNPTGVDAGLVSITDRMPPGFSFVEGSATVDGVAADPVVAGSNVTFEGIDLNPRTTVQIRLVLRAGANVTPGIHRNVATGVDYLGTSIAPPAHADIRVEAEAIFDCSDVIGTVFDDRNGNGYQDQGEPGLAGVRLATVRGTLITTDEHGRFSIPCAALPDSRTGSNFVLKLDTRTLPTGYAMTTDNPAMVRLTAGKMVEVNFGASVGRQLKLALDGTAFVKGSAEPNDELRQGLAQLVGLLGDERTTVTVTYAGQPGELVRQRLEGVVATIRELWREAGAPYELVINTEVLER